MSQPCVLLLYNFNSTAPASCLSKRMPTSCPPLHCCGQQVVTWWGLNEMLSSTAAGAAEKGQQQYSRPPVPAGNVGYTWQAGQQTEGRNGHKCANNKNQGGRHSTYVHKTGDAGHIKISQVQRGVLAGRWAPSLGPTPWLSSTAGCSRGRACSRTSPAGRAGQGARGRVTSTGCCKATHAVHSRPVVVKPTVCSQPAAPAQVCHTVW